MERMSPGADLDFLFDVTDWLGSGETVSSATWTLESGLTGGTQTDTTAGSTLQIAAGSVAGKTCRVIVEIATNAGNTFRRTWFIKVQEQLESD